MKTLILGAALALVPALALADGLEVRYVCAGVTRVYEGDIVGRHYDASAGGYYSVNVRQNGTAGDGVPAGATLDSIFHSGGESPVQWYWQIATPPGSGLPWIAGSGRCTWTDDGLTVSLMCDLPPAGSTCP